MIVGVLGGGQLGRMLGLAAANLGVRVRFMDTSAEAPARHVGELIVDDFDRPRRLSEFVRGLSLVTYEFENVPAALVERLSRTLKVYPGPEALRQAQDRLNEKTLFSRLGIPTARFAPIDGPGDVPAALAQVGLPAVIKTRRLGYDGKGQALVRTTGQAAAAAAELGTGRIPLIAEQFVRFDREVSVIGVRSADGSTAFYPLTENVHAAGILRTSRAPLPGRGAAALQRLAERHARRVLAEVEYVGVLAIEFFERAGSLLANEMAPRVHNSGHWTIDGAACSQFENHLRGILGLPLGPTGALGAAGMVNLIGDWPPLARLAAIDGARVHLYDKQPRPGRKVGHVNVSAPSAAQRERVMRAVEREVRRAGRIS